MKLRDMILVESTPRTLYHGTVRANIAAILAHGIWPSVGDFTKSAYQEAIDAGIELPELVFAADKDHIGSCISAIGAWIKRTRPEISDVYSREAIGRYGALCVLKHQGDDFEHRGSDVSPVWSDFEDSDHPEQVEPGDYYSRRTVRVDHILTGNRLLAFLIKYGGRAGRDLSNSFDR